MCIALRIAILHLLLCTCIVSGLSSMLRARRLTCALSHSQRLGGRVNVRAYMSTPSSSSPYSYDPPTLDLGDLATPGTKISPFWLQQLARIEHPAAQQVMRSSLTPKNELGYAGLDESKPASLSSELRGWKLLHPEKVVLVRVGEFYEFCGVDAVIAVAYCGLNAMGGKARAGCPIANIQMTLDDLTQQGFTVAVYEELADTDTIYGKEAKSTKKRRILADIVSPASSTYTYGNMRLRADDINFRESKPGVGIMETSRGFMLCQVYLDERRTDVSERLTQEGVSSLLAMSGFADVVYFQRLSSDIPSLSSSGARVHPLSGYDEASFPQQIIRRVLGTLCRDTDHLEEVAASMQIYGTAYSDRPLPLYISTAHQIGLMGSPDVPSLERELLPPKSTASARRFLRRWVLNPPPHDIADSMRSLCSVLSAAPHPTPSPFTDTTPDTYTDQLDDSQPPNSQAPAPYAPYTALPPLPRFDPVPTGKIIKLLWEQQANTPLFRDIQYNLQALQQLLTMEGAGAGAGEKGEIGGSESGRLGGLEAGNFEKSGVLLDALLALTSYESHLPATLSHFRSQVPLILSKLEAVVQPVSQRDPFSSHRETDPDTTKKTTKDPQKNPASMDPFADQDVADMGALAGVGRVPGMFFIECELGIRGLVVPTHPGVAPAHAEVARTAQALCDVVGKDLEGLPVAHEKSTRGLFVTAKSLKGLDSSLEGEIDYDGTHTRKRSTGGRKTTRGVVEAVGAYQEAVARLETSISTVLRELSASLRDDVVTIVQTMHLAVILDAAQQHCREALRRGWVLPVMLDSPDTDPNAAAGGNEAGAGASVGPTPPSPTPPLVLSGLSPYWMDRDGCQLNDVELGGVWLLTAPNMSGKSTLMRSVLVAALLGNTGLYVPCTRACIPRYKTFFLRMSGNDIPAAGKSALAVECDDLRLLQRDCALPHSLVMVDELGKGTSSKEGAAVAGAVLEWLDQSPRITAIFSTHLHELFDMGLRLGGVQEKTIGFSEGGGGGGYGGSAGSSGDRESSTTGGSGDSGSGRTDGAEQGGQGGQGGQGQSSEHLLQDGRCTNSMALATAKQCGVDANLIQRAAQLMCVFDERCRGGGGGSEGVGGGVGGGGAVTTAPPIPTPTPTPTLTYSLQQLAPLICASASSSTPESVFLTSDIVFLTYNSQPPVYLDDRPCLYVLRVQSKQAPDQLYVGETNSIHTRLEQHRQTFGKDRYFESAVLPVRGSKRAEGRLIKMLREGGFDLLNSKEGGMYCGEGE